MMNRYYEKRQISVAEGEQFDVIVCGGGTAGCAAAIAAARTGAKTLMIERSFTCGGMLTKGNAGITKFTEHYSDKIKYRELVLNKLKDNATSVQVVGGIAKEYVDRMIKSGGAVATDGQAGSYVFTDRYEAQYILMEMLQKAGVAVLYDTSVCDVVMNENIIRGVLVWNKAGFTRYYADMVVDATGDGDVAAQAGANSWIGATSVDIKEGGGVVLGQTLTAGCMYRVRGVDCKKLLNYLQDNPNCFVQHNFGVMMLDDVLESAERGQMYVFRFNVTLSDGTITPVQFYNAPAEDEAVLLGFGAGTPVNGLDPFDVSLAQHRLWLGVRDAFSYIRKNIPGFENSRMCYLPDVGVRETRRIEGDYILTGHDLIYGVQFEDSIGCGGHPVDIGPVNEEIEHIEYEHWKFYIPYRVLLPKGIENMLVAGRSVSATRLASGCLRPTAQCMVMGEAAGTAAALAVRYKTTCRDLPYSYLKNELVNNGVVL